MNSLVNRRTSGFALAGLVGAALVGGCCQKRYQSTAYHTQRTGAYSDISTSQQAPPPTGRTEFAARAESGTNMVVPLFQESVNVGKREVEAGSVRLKKIVKTETVNQPVELRHEEVVIDRESGAGPSQNQVLSQPFQEGETVIRLKREEPVIEKQTAPAGQIVVQTRSAAEQRNIQSQVRREDIDIAKEGNAQNVIIGENVHASVRGAAGAAESAGGQARGAGVSGSATVITDPAIFSSSSDASTLAGRQAKLSGLKVQRVVGDRLYVFQDTQGKKIYVLAREQTPSAKVGDSVTITGTVKATSGTDAGLTGEAAQEFSSSPIYVEAQRIEVTNQ